MQDNSLKLNLPLSLCVYVFVHTCVFVPTGSQILSLLIDTLLIVFLDYHIAYYIQQVKGHILFLVHYTPFRLNYRTSPPRSVSLCCGFATIYVG